VCRTNSVSTRRCGWVRGVRAYAAAKVRALGDGARKQRDAHIRRDAADDPVERAELEAGGTGPAHVGEDLLELLPIGTAGAEYQNGDAGGPFGLLQHLQGRPARRGDEHQFLAERERRVEIRMADRTGHECAVERPVDDVPYQCGGRAGLQAKLHLRKLPVEAGEHRRQAHGGRRLHRSDQQGTLRAAIVARRENRLTRHHREALGIRQQALARIGEPHAAIMPFEQWDADLGLQRLHACGDVGLHGTEFGGRAGDPSAPRDGGENRQIGELHRAISLSDGGILDKSFLQNLSG
jgi:hypothetical protein